jgi:hypothetical protein
MNLQPSPIAFRAPHALAVLPRSDVAMWGECEQPRASTRGHSFGARDDVVNARIASRLVVSSHLLPGDHEVCSTSMSCCLDGDSIWISLRRLELDPVAYSFNITRPSITRNDHLTTARAEDEQDRTDSEECRRRGIWRRCIHSVRSWQSTSTYPY